MSLKQKIKKYIGKAILLVGCGVIGFVSLLLFSARAPEMHGYILRSYVGSHVYMIKDQESGGNGGTGFAIRAPSGKSYILTNDHVCGLSSDGKSLFITDDHGLSIRRNIIERSDFTDLCLIEGIPGVVGLRVGAQPIIGQIIASIGHPDLMKITLSRGEIITQEDGVSMVGTISVFNPQTGKESFVPLNRGGVSPEQCEQRKNRQVIKNINVMFFMLRAKVCIQVVKDAYRTNMLVQGGSSGSPVVDFWGQVIGVVYAQDPAHWGIAVPHADLVEFLKGR